MSAQHTPELIQRARDIAADVFVEYSLRQGKPSSHETFKAWGDHLDTYSRFTRDGSYDDYRDVQIAIAALASVQP